MKEVKELKFLSLDAETNGLWGKPFTIAVTGYDANGDETVARKWAIKNLNSVVTNNWVKENVLPALELEGCILVDSYDDLLKEFADFYNQHKSAKTMWHMGHIVETHLFRECVSKGLIGEWDAPYTPIEISSILLVLGEKEDSVDAYISKHQLDVELGSTHDPLYDCRVAAAVYFHAIKRRA